MPVMLEGATAPNEASVECLQPPTTSASLSCGDGTSRRRWRTHAARKRVERGLARGRDPVGASPVTAYGHSTPIADVVRRRVPTCQGTCDHGNACKPIAHPDRSNVGRCRFQIRHMAACRAHLRASPRCSGGLHRRPFLKRSPIRRLITCALLLGLAGRDRGPPMAPAARRRPLWGRRVAGQPPTQVATCSATWLAAWLSAGATAAAVSAATGTRASKRLVVTLVRPRVIAAS